MFKKSCSLALAAILSTSFSAMFCGAYAQQVFPAPKSGVQPTSDAFYTSPGVAELENATPGTILRYRPITSSTYGSTLSGAYQLMYRTSDTKDRPTASITTVLIPKNAPLLASQRQLLSYQAFYDALNLKCAPSYNLTKNTLFEQSNVKPALAKGIVVTIADYEGLDSQWIVGLNTAHGVLDSIRAVEQFQPAKLNGAATPVGLMGYSGGGHASAWANEVAPTYAPELNIIGVAMGGLPVKLDNVARKVDGKLFSGVYLGAIAGLLRAYGDEIDIDRLANAKGKQMLTAIADACLLSEFAGAPEMLFYAYKSAKDYIVVPDLLEDPQIKAIIVANSLGQRTPKAPMYVYEATMDEIMPLADVDDLVKGYCDAGIKVQYRRALADHISLGISPTNAMNYLLDRFAGKAVPSTCK